MYLQQSTVAYLARAMINRSVLETTRFSAPANGVLFLVMMLTMPPRPIWWELHLRARQFLRQLRWPVFWARFRSFLDHKQLVAMQQNADKFYFFCARFRAKHDYALREWRKFCLVFGRNFATFLATRRNSKCRTYGVQRNLKTLCVCRLLQFY